MILSGGIVFDGVIAPHGKRLDIRIADGRIVEIGGRLRRASEEVVDVSRLHVYPGSIDLHVHLREPGQTHKEDILTATEAAAAGGVTTMLAMPNTTPPIDSGETYSMVQQLIEQKSKVEVLQTAAMTMGRKGEALTDFSALEAQGCHWLTDDGSSVQDQRLMLRACEQIKKTGQLWIEHPEVVCLAEGRPLHDGKAAHLMGWEGQPREAESLAILQLGLMAGRAGVRVHFTHISTWQSVEAVCLLKRWYPGLFTADTTPHYLFFTDEDVIASSYDANKKMTPPLRSQEDRQALIKGILDGTIDCVASDHAPHTEEEKRQGIATAPFGVIGLETLLPALYTLFTKQKHRSPGTWLPLVTTMPARILGIDRGRIAPGKVANIVAFNSKAQWLVQERDFHSRSRNSAFLGTVLHGGVVATYVNGKKVYEKGR